MDTVTHTLFGLILFRAINKQDMSKEMKRSVLFTSLVGSQIPDIDVVSQWWDTSGQYLMWHRGITHSLLMIPVWALLIWLMCFLIWRTKDRRLLYLGLLAVFIHDTSDIFNAWGTGYFEPLSTMRLAFGTVPIVDVAVWVFILIGFLVARFRKQIPAPRVFRWVWCAIALHFAVQSVQGYVIHDQVEDRYEQIALSAEFVPWHFNVIGKRGNVVEISEATVWSDPQVLQKLPTAANADLSSLFKKNPKAKTLQQWAPMIVIVDDDKRVGVYDPRFYRNGQSFLFEFIEKTQSEKR